MTRTCSNCLSIIDADAAFCASCALPMGQNIICPKCEKTINFDSKFCKYCAFSISNPIYDTAENIPFINQNPSNSSPLPQVEPSGLTQADSSSVQTEETGDNPATLISPAGAAFVLICFFLPWIQYSCKDVVIDTGADIAKRDSILWLIPIMAIVSIAAYIICKRQKVLFKARPYIIASSAFALCFFIYKFIGLLSEFKYFDPQNVGPQATEIKSGSIGTIIGFALAIIGCLFMRKTVEISDESEEIKEYYLEK